MIPVPPGVRVLIAIRPIDFRKGADSLAALSKETLAQDPFSGAVLAPRFRSRVRDEAVALHGEIRRPVPSEGGEQPTYDRTEGRPGAGGYH